MGTSKTLTWVMVLVLALPGMARAQGQMSWAVAARPDDKIASLVERLTPYLEPLPGLQDAAGAILYHQILVAADEDDHRRCENLVITVREPEDLPGELMQPRQGGDDEVQEFHAFVMRDGAIRRLSEAEATHVPGEAEIGRGHFEFDWGELKDGDVVGWSVVTRQKAPWRFVPIRLAERLPMVIATIGVESDGRYAYQVKRFGISSKDVSQKKDEAVEGRAMSVKASVNQRPAAEEIPDELPWPADFPAIALALEEVKVEAENQFVKPGWAKTGGWNQSLLALQAAVSAQADDLKGTDIVLSTITTGKTTPAAKADAVCGWVRDKVELLEGPQYLSGGQRPVQEVFQARKGTGLEKVLLAAALLEKLEVPVTVAGFRPATLGPIDPDWTSTAQLDDALIRLADTDGIRYWAPQCGECESGTLPAHWSGADVVAVDHATLEVARKFQEKKQQEAMREGKLDLAEIQAEIESQAWVLFEKVP